MRSGAVDDSKVGIATSWLNGRTHLAAVSDTAAAPSISVVIPCFAQAEFLHGAVESIVGQTRPDWEVVIVDDGSPDATAEVALAAVEEFGDRVQLVRQSNRGVAAARNAGIAIARGRYVVPLDADDVLEPEFLARTAGALDSDPAIGVAYTDYVEFGARDRTVIVPEFDFEGLCRGNHIISTAMFRKEAWQAAGGYNPNMTLLFEDWDFWIGCAERGFRPRRIPGALVRYRIRAGSRNDRTPLERRQMTEQLMANHPTLYTARRRIVRRVRRVPRNLARQATRLLVRASAGRLTAPSERW
jgi:glycosyltransferase involved in cell wall biosynthesis